MSERDVTNKIKKWIESKHGVCHKVHGGPMSSGFPDLIACINGRAWIIEVKVPCAKPRVPKPVREGYCPVMRAWMERGATVLQAQTLYRWQTAGAVAALATDIEDMERIYREVMQ